MASNIREARKLINRAIDSIAQAKEALDEAMGMMTRASPVRRAPRKVKAKLTAHKAKLIRHYAKRHPQASMRAIGNRFRVDSGRVSEVLTGARFAE